MRVWNAVNGQEDHGYYFDGQTPLRASAFAPSGAQLEVGGDDSIVRLGNGLVCLQQRQSEFGSRCMDAPSLLFAGFLHEMHQCLHIIKCTRRHRVVDTRYTC